MIRINSKAYLILAPAFVLLILYPLVVKDAVYLDIFIMFCLFAGLGGAWNITGGYSGLFSIGHAGFFGIGAYTSTLLYLRFGVSPWLGMVIGGIGASFISMLAFYPCFKLRGIFFTMASLAFAEILLILSIYWQSLTGGNVGLLILYKPGFAHFMFSEKLPYAYIALAYMLVIFGVTFLIEKAKIGSHLLAIREDEDAAESLGVRSTRDKLYAMMISAFFTAMGGTIYAQYTQFIDPDTLFDVALSVRYALLAIIGGIGSLFGPLIGSAILTPMDTLLRSWLGGSYAGLGFVTYGVFLIAVVLLLPEGVMKWFREKIFPSLEKLPDLVLGKGEDRSSQAVPASPRSLSHPVKTDEALLEIRGVTKKFGGLVALSDVSITIGRGEIVGLIGPNGAGKTTLFNVIDGFYGVDEGKILFNNQDITNLKPPHRICLKGIGRTFQIVKPFPNITVFNNVLVGAWKGSSSVKEARRKTLDILDFVGLSKYKDYAASSLTISDRKRLELARALATSPDLLLLDEVMAGLNPTETEAIIGLVKQISTETKTTLFIIEHVMKAVMSLSERIVVLDYGQKIAEGGPEEVVRMEEVIKAYLGEDYFHHVASSRD